MTYENRFSDDSYSAYNFFDEGDGIVTLCGSTKFFSECMEINRRLTFKGWIVLMCGSWGHSYHKDFKGNTGADYDKVKTLHYKKILISQAIVVVSDKSGYVGNSTKAEVLFSKYKGVPIFYFDGEYLTGHTFKTPEKLLTIHDKIIDDYVTSGGNLGF
jgi:hypothetical protein